MDMQEEHLRLPRPYNIQDAEEVIQIAERINKDSKFCTELDTDIIEKLSYTSRGDLSPMAALFGGVVGQEALKAISGKFHPLFQFLYFDSTESLPADSPREEDCQPTVRPRWPQSMASLPGIGDILKPAVPLAGLAFQCHLDRRCSSVQSKRLGSS